MEKLSGFGRIGRLGFIAVLSITAVMGGCKKGQTTEQREAQELRERAATLDEQVRSKDARIAELENSNRMLQTQATQPAPVTPAGGYDDGGGAGGNAGSGRTASRGSGSPTPTGRFKSSGNGVVAVISGSKIFASGSATVSRGAYADLDAIARDIKRSYSGYAVRVEGHTDKTPIKKSANKWKTNEELSQARADAVRKYLISKGVPSSSIDAAGMGASRPKSTNEASRRIEIHVD
jgi:flagellar motor protein MotB